MLPRDSRTMARLQELVTALIERRVASSLVDVEAALVRWREGSLSALGAHGAVLRHAARCEHAIEQVTAAATDRPEGVLRDAVDVGLMPEPEFVALTGVAVDAVEPTHALDQEAAVPVPNKRKTVEALMEQGPVLIHVDPRRPGVAVPARFAADPGLRLRFGYGLSPAIANLVIDDLQVAGTLSFGGVPFHCVLPWTAVYAVQIDGDSKGSVWPDDVPDVVLAHAAETFDGDDAAESDDIDDERDWGSNQDGNRIDPSNAKPAKTPAASPDPVKKKGGHLKLVE